MKNWSDLPAQHQHRKPLAGRIHLWLITQQGPQEIPITRFLLPLALARTGLCSANPWQADITRTRSSTRSPTPHTHDLSLTGARSPPSTASATAKMPNERAAATDTMKRPTNPPTLGSVFPSPTPLTSQHCVCTADHRPQLAWVPAQHRG